MEINNQYLRRSADNRALQHAYDTMIRSVSGWRKIFAAHEQSRSPNITPADHILLLLATHCFAQFLQKRSIVAQGTKPINIALARDRRPTSNPIARTMMSAFRTAGITIYNRGICPSPELMAYTAENSNIHGFCYITASHNPIGYNGLKFGNATGKILEPEEGRELIQLFEDQFNTIINLKKPSRFAGLGGLGKSSRSSAKTVPEYAHVAKGHVYWGKTIKEQSRAAYMTRLSKAASIKAKAKTKEATKTNRSLSVLIDANGCARSHGADAEWLATLGAGCTIMAKHRVQHEILPEGDAMHACMRKLETLWKKDNSYQLGYVSDGDGDRGNIVYIDTNTGKARQLSPQETFSMLLLARLSLLQDATKNKQSKNQTNEQAKNAHKALAIVINAATSRMVVELAERFNTQAIITETGEANICAGIALAEESGYRVGMAGEGSNGGVIIPPHMVRDPLLSITILLQYLRAHPEKTISDLLADIPPYQYTQSSDKRAALHLDVPDRSQLVKDYIALLYEKLANIPEPLKAFGITHWRHVYYNASSAETIEDARHALNMIDGNAAGGNVIEFLAADAIKARIWMRPSATEAHIRIMADIKGGGADCEAIESFLLDMQQQILQASAEKQA